MARLIIACPDCNKAIWTAETNSLPRIPNAYKELQNYTQPYEELVDDCSCEIGAELKNKYQNKLLDLDSVLSFGIHRNKTLQHVINTDKTYVSNYLLEKTDWDITIQAEFYLKNHKQKSEVVSAGSSNVKCPYCRQTAVWCENKEIYGKNMGKSYMCYYCKPCGAYVGCHNNTKKPLGTLANKELREKRKEVHAIIDPLWKSCRFSRKIVYQLLSNEFQEDIHIGESDMQRCNEIIAVAKQLFQIK